MKRPEKLSAAAARRIALAAQGLHRPRPSVEPGRAALMKAELQRLAGHSGLSRDTREQVTRSLDG